MKIAHAQMALGHNMGIVLARTAQDLHMKIAHVRMAQGLHMATAHKADQAALEGEALVVPQGPVHAAQEVQVAELMLKRPIRQKTKEKPNGVHANKLARPKKIKEI